MCKMKISEYTFTTTWIYITVVVCVYIHTQTVGTFKNS